MPRAGVASTTPAFRDGGSEGTAACPRCETVRVSKPNLPTVIEVMAEYGGTVLWNRSPAPNSSSYQIDPADLGVSSTLGTRLSAWNDHWQDMVYRGALESPGSAEVTAWTRDGLDLAFDVQHELDALGHDIDVRYHHDDDPRPLRERRGP